MNKLKLTILTLIAFLLLATPVYSCVGLESNQNSFTGTLVSSYTIHIDGHDYPVDCIQLQDSTGEYYTIEFAYMSDEIMNCVDVVYWEFDGLSGELDNIQFVEIDEFGNEILIEDW